MRPEFQRIQITPSILDRLLDDAPRELTEGSMQRAFDLHRLKQSVARDMEALLNSRSVDLDESIDHFPQARKNAPSGRLRARKFTSSTCVRRAARHEGPYCGSRYGRCRTDAEKPGAGRKAGSDCKRER